MRFFSLPDVTTACHNYGKVYAPGDPDPSQCHATGRCLKTAVVGEKFTAILQTLDFSSKPCSHPINSLECELVSEITGSRVIGNVEYGDGRVSVFTCEAQFVTSFGRKGEGPGEFNRPFGLAVDNCGVVYVCYHNNKHIKCF